jgi:hypothetical protein
LDSIFISTPACWHSSTFAKWWLTWSTATNSTWIRCKLHHATIAVLTLSVAIRVHLSPTHVRFEKHEF